MTNATGPWIMTKEKEPPRDGSWILGEWGMGKDRSLAAAFYYNGCWVVTLCESIESDPNRYALISEWQINDI